MEPRTAPAATPPHSPPGTARSTSCNPGNDTAQAPTRIPKTPPSAAPARPRSTPVRRWVVAGWKESSSGGMALYFTLSRFARDASELLMQLPDRIEHEPNEASTLPVSVSTRRAAPTATLSVENQASQCGTSLSGNGTLGARPSATRAATYGGRLPRRVGRPLALLKSRVDEREKPSARERCRPPLASEPRLMGQIQGAMR